MHVLIKADLKESNDLFLLSDDYQAKSKWVHPPLKKNLWVYSILVLMTYWLLDFISQHCILQSTVCVNWCTEGGRRRRRELCTLARSPQKYVLKISCKGNEYSQQRRPSRSWRVGKRSVLSWNRFSFFFLLGLRCCAQSYSHETAIDE